MKTTKRESALNYYSQFAKAENYKDELFIFQYNKLINRINKNMPCITIFGKRGHKPIKNCYFNTEQERTDYLNREKQSADNETEQKNRMLAARLIECEQYKVGAIVYDSWGCEQTNIDFYEIIGRVNNTITLQQIGEKRSYYHSGMSGETMPDNTKKVGEPFKKRISKNGYLTIKSYSCCKLWDGKEKSFSCYA